MNPNRFDEVSQSGAIEAFPEMNKADALVREVVFETGLSVEDALAASHGIAKELAETDDLDGVSIQDDDTEGAMSGITQTRTHVIFYDKVNDDRVAMTVEEYHELLGDWKDGMASKHATLDSTERAQSNNDYYVKLGRAVTGQISPSNA